MVAHLSSLVSSMSSFSPPVGWFLAGCWSLLCCTGCGEISQHPSLIVGGAKLRTRLELLREQTQPASLPRPPGARLAGGPLFDFWPCKRSRIVLYSKQTGRRLSTPRVQGRT